MAIGFVVLIPREPDHKDLSRLQGNFFELFFPIRLGKIFTHTHFTHIYTNIEYRILVQYYVSRVLVPPRWLRGHNHQSRLLPALFHLRRGTHGGEQGNVQAVLKVRGKVPGK